MDLKEMLEHFIEHRHEIIVRRTQFDLDEAQAREHILEGLKIAVDNIDEVIKIIRVAADTPERRCRGSASAFGLSREAGRRDPQHAPRQAHRARTRQARGGAGRGAGHHRRPEGHPGLAGHGASSILKAETAEVVAETTATTAAPRSSADQGDFSVEDLIAEEDMVITISHAGYIKRIPVTTYRRQRRGGRGMAGMGTKEDDWVEHLFIASHPRLPDVLHRQGPVLLAQGARDPAGRARRARQAGRQLHRHRGATSGSRRLVPVREFADDHWLMFATRNGTVKKTVLSAYGNSASNGINAINIEEGDELIDVQLTRRQQRHRAGHARRA